MTATTTRPASEKQLTLIGVLLDERDMRDGVRDATRILVAQPDFAVRDASRLITQLMAMPKKVRAAAVATSARPSLIPSTVPKSKYALPVAELGALGIDLGRGNDLIFVEIKEFRGTTYLRQLHGAPGHFNRSKLRNDQVTDLVAVLEADPLRYTQLFGKHYSCCGCCGAELTDEVSRRLQLGPHCRTKFGL